MLYADVNGSAQLCSKVADFLAERSQTNIFANPNSSHYLGQKILKEVEDSREICAKHLGAKPEQIIFNSGSSEAISHIFFHYCHRGPQNNKNLIITSSIEHSAINQAAKFYEGYGYETIFVKTTNDGTVDLDDLQKIISGNAQRIAFVTIMAANNETGVIQPISEVYECCKEHHVPFFSDTTQYIGKTKFNFNESGFDFACLSGHKIGALIGSGLILVKNPKEFTPFVFGGGQEQGIRGGTQNYIGIKTLGIAIDTFDFKLNHLNEVRKQRKIFEANLKNIIPSLVIIGEKAKRLPSTSLISVPGVSGKTVQCALELHKVYVSTSSACSDSSQKMSRVLQSMNCTEEIGKGVVRISIGCCTAPEETYKKLTTQLMKVYEKKIGKSEESA